jgi:DNA-binding response OmpR family regulator
MQNEEKLSKKLIFVCDDDAYILEAIKIILTDQGYKVETFEDGEHLLKRLETAIPDLILLDYWMARRDGKQTVYDLKECEKTRNIKVLLVSAINNIELVAKNLNIEYFLAKPFGMDVLISKVKSLIS